MSSTSAEALLSQWNEAASAPFNPLFPKGAQPIVAFVLVWLALSLTGLFSMNKSFALGPLIAFPASLAFGFGVVFTLCTFGVYP